MNVAPEITFAAFALQSDGSGWMLVLAWRGAGTGCVGIPA